MEFLGERQGFGDIVRSLRAERGWPLDELAIRLKKSRASISRIENGKQNLTFDDIVAIARAFEVPTRTLFGVSGQQAVPEAVRVIVHQCAQKAREVSHMADYIEQTVTFS
jgi:transcriptional regulator with XRE-family HTH domain